MTARSARRGYTLFELIVVMMILLMLAAVVLPSVAAFRGDTRQRAAADTVRGELATARGRAMEEGRPYRVAVSPDGTRIRRGPDGADFAEAAGFGHPDPAAAVVEYALEHVTTEVLVEDTGAAPVTENGWVTVATLLPNGTGLEDSVTVGVRENGGAPLRIHVRGLTGTSRILPVGGAR